MVHELGEGAFVWNGVRIGAVRVSDEYIRGSIPMHRHAADSFELHIVLAGRGEVCTRTGSRPVGAGDFYLTIGEAEHEQRSEPSDPVRELCVYATFSGNARSAARALLSCPFFLGRADEDMLLCARQTAKELAQVREGFEDALRCYFQLLLIGAARVRTSGIAQRRGVLSGGALYLKIEEAFLYGYRTVTLSSLAAAAGLSERQTQRVLSAHYGQTFTQMRTEARMRAANVLLAESSVSVARIAEETGYSCAEHFCAEYKKFMGMTAGAYRRLCRGQGQGKSRPSAQGK